MQQQRRKHQPFNYYCVLDLEGKVEILELPVLLLNGQTGVVIDTFHHYVRPTKMPESEINDYIAGKYGRICKDTAEAWHKTALCWPEVITKLEQWLLKHNLQFDKNLLGHSFAFITCGNWDIKTQIPKQYSICDMVLPDHFNRWINVKQVYNDHYKPKNAVTGMRGLLNRLKLNLDGVHHFGLDDSNNIAKIVETMMEQGIVFDITGTRSSVMRTYTTGSSSRPKCKFYQAGTCRHGDHCRFSHQ
jgi:ERI1 exoribonuclease 3